MHEPSNLKYIYLELSIQQPAKRSVRLKFKPALLSTLPAPSRIGSKKREKKLRTAMS